MFEFVVGLGQGGSRIAREFSLGFEAPATYMNLTGVDFSKFDAPRNSMLVVNAHGTGRDPVFGERVAREHIEEVREHLAGVKGYDRARYALVTVGGGGGSGTGLMFPVIEALLRAKKEVLLVYTLPEKREGVPAKPNALLALDRVIDLYLRRDSDRKISVLLVDNDYCVQRYGSSDRFDYWRGVNVGVVRSLKRFWLMTNLEQHHNYIDVTSGYKALDQNDLLRVLFSKNGYTDVREIIFEKPDLRDLTRKVRDSSLVMGSLDIRTAKRYIVALGMPDEWKSAPGLLRFVDGVFTAVAKMTADTPDAVRCSYFSKRVDRMHVHLLLAGMARSKALTRMTEQSVRDLRRLDDKEDVERIDVEALTNYRKRRRG